ncbi:PriCT-2 domain-containing protein [filamentous cyanobacterium LEGE 11480]|uniref:PriCT-2 domain-containing protein n=1 Tax=Romeriopsis navalis LEGE 11480 TaxID=2777977 RepID=A0A928VTK6_9CYAN|nr:PriCT-2 domain-containing protein [Romeriopsis navalis]MBE9031824.1 PriCT-2 domain-containing protein [Romeriopsis navalis LEGE 11480]
MPALLDGNLKRWQINSNHAEVLALDIDDGLSIDQALQHPFIQQHCGLLIESASSTPEHNKFRLVFVLEQPIEGWQNVRIANRYLAEQVGSADRNCKDANRFFFGAPGRKPVLIKAVTLGESFATNALAWGEAIEAEEQRRAEAARQQWASRRAEMSDEDSDALILKALDTIDPNCDYNDWIGVGMVLHGLGDHWFTAWDQWSAGAGSYNPREMQTHWKSFRGKGDGNPAGLFGIAKRYGFKMPRREFTPEQRRAYAQAKAAERGDSKKRPIMPDGLTRDEQRAWRKKQRQIEARSVFAKYATTDATVHKVDRVTDMGISPELGSAVLVNSLTGSGKTHWAAEIIAEKQADTLGKFAADYICHRRMLVADAAPRLGLTPIDQLDPYTPPETGVACCIDSYLKRVTFALDWMEAGNKYLLTIDETDAVIRHLLESTTISETKRSRLIAGLSAVLQAIADGGGWVIGGESHLSDLAAKSLRELSGGNLAVEVHHNAKSAPEPWKIIDYSEDEEGKHYTSLKPRLFTLVENLLSQGRVPLVMPGSQTSAEQLDFYLTNLGYRVLRVDRTTSGDPAVREFLRLVSIGRKGQRLPIAYDVVIGTTTMGTGVSIDSEYFTDVVAGSGKLNPFDVLQGMGRDRNPIVRHLICAEGTRQGGESDAAKILRRKRGFAAAVTLRHGVTHTAPRRVLRVAESLAAGYQAFDDAARTNCHENLIAMLEADGHNIEHGEIEVYQDFADRFARSETDRARALTDEWLNLPVLDIPRSDAVKRQQQVIPRIERLKLEKTVLWHDFSNLVNDRAWVTEFVIGNEAQRRRRAIKNGARYNSFDRSLEFERVGLETQLAINGTFSALGLRDDVEKNELLKSCGFDAVLAEVEISIHTPSVVAFVAALRKRSGDLWRLFKLTITDHTRIIDLIRSLCERLGISLGKATQRRVTLGASSVLDSSTAQCDGKPKSTVVRFYPIMESIYRDQMIESLDVVESEALIEAKAALELIRSRDEAPEMPKYIKPTYQVDVTISFEDETIESTSISA